MKKVKELLELYGDMTDRERQMYMQGQMDAAQGKQPSAMSRAGNIVRKVGGVVGNAVGTAAKLGGAAALGYGAYKMATDPNNPVRAAIGNAMQQAGGPTPTQAVSTPGDPVQPNMTAAVAPEAPVEEPLPANYGKYTGEFDPQRATDRAYDSRQPIFNRQPKKLL